MSQKYNNQENYEIRSKMSLKCKTITRKMIRRKNEPEIYNNQENDDIRRKI